MGLIKPVEMVPKRGCCHIVFMESFTKKLLDSALEIKESVGVQLRIRLYAKGLVSSLHRRAEKNSDATSQKNIKL